MNIDNNFFKIETNKVLPKPGKLLIAEPFLNDYYFGRSVILLTEHSTEGSVGFVLNKPVKISLNEILTDFPKFDSLISVGGPVKTDSVHYIHTLGKFLPDSVEIADGIFWGGNFSELKKIIKSGLINKNQIRFFIGYSGWSANQLEDELKINSWLVSNLDAKTIMRKNEPSIWKESILNLGEEYKTWINFPENPNLN